MIHRLGRRLHNFYEHHEKSFRTEIVLVPVLVMGLKLFESSLDKFSTTEKIVFIIGASLLGYVIGLIILTIIGDFIWRKFLFKFSDLYPYHGTYIQVRGAEGRGFAISRIVVNYKKGTFQYRGVAFDDSGRESLAAWDSKLVHHDEIDRHPVLYFAGNSKISKEPKYDINTFDTKVYSIMLFTGERSFRGAGFDFRRLRNRGEDHNVSFPIAGHKVDDRAMDEYGIDPRILLDLPLTVYPKDKDAIRAYAVDCELLPQGPPAAAE